MTLWDWAHARRRGTARLSDAIISLARRTRKGRRRSQDVNDPSSDNRRLEARIRQTLLTIHKNAGFACRRRRQKMDVIEAVAIGSAERVSPDEHLICKILDDALPPFRKVDKTLGVAAESQCPAFGSRRRSGTFEPAVSKDILSESWNEIA